MIKINLEKLKENVIFKNHKDLCNQLEIEYKNSTNCKNAQLKELNRYCKLEKNGHKIKVIEVYDSPLKKENNYKGTQFTTKSIKETNPRLASQWDKIKNNISCDKITRNDMTKRWWICDICNQSIYVETRKRFHKSKGMKDENLTCSYCWASKGSKLIYKALVQSNILFETEYTFNDLVGLGNKKLRFDYAIPIGEYSIALIEFDGGFHDVQDKLKAHDNLKNVYCKSNKIPLLRIHHLDTSSLNNQLMEFFISLNLDFDKLYLTNECEIENDESLQQLVKLKNEKETLLHRLSAIENEIRILNQA